MRINVIYIIIPLLIVCIGLYKYIKKESFENKKRPSVGFIITRHVNNESVNKVWISCVQQIRKSYPTNKIVIIDDNSNYEFNEPSRNERKY